MSRTYRVRNHPVGSFVGGLIGIGMLVFGLRHFPLGDGDGFVFFWVLVVVGITLTNFYNAFSKRGVTGKIIEAHDPAPPPNAAAQLRRLDDLRRQNLLTFTEYESRRSDVVRRLPWLSR